MQRTPVNARQQQPTQVHPKPVCGKTMMCNQHSGMQCYRMHTQTANNFSVPTKNIMRGKNCLMFLLLCLNCLCLSLQGTGGCKYKALQATTAWLLNLKMKHARQGKPEKMLCDVDDCEYSNVSVAMYCAISKPSYLVRNKGAASCSNDDAMRMQGLAISP
jgi:hypothetical protein